MRSLAAKALKGDIRAINQIVNMSYRLLEMDSKADEEELSQDDLSILENNKTRILRENATTKTRKKDPAKRKTTRPNSSRQSGKGRGQKP